MNTTSTEPNSSQRPTSSLPPRDESLVLVLSGSLTLEQVKVLHDGGFRVAVVTNVGDTIDEHDLAHLLPNVQVMTWKEATHPAHLFTIGTIIVDSTFPQIHIPEEDVQHSPPILALKLIIELRRRDCEALIATSNPLPSSNPLSAQQNDAAMRAGARIIVRWDDHTVPTLRSLLAVQRLLHPSPVRSLAA